MDANALAVPCCSYQQAAIWDPFGILIFAFLLAFIFYALTKLVQPAPKPLSEALNDIFQSLEDRARRWERTEALGAIHESRTEILKLLKDRKLL